MLNSLVRESLKRFVGRLMIIVAVFVFATVWFYCHRADEMRAAHGVVYSHKMMVE